MNKMPCATCPEICENAFGLYNAYHLTKEYLEGKEGSVTKMKLYCHKEKATYVIEGEGLPK